MKAINIFLIVCIVVMVVLIVAIAPWDNSIVRHFTQNKVGPINFIDKLEPVDGDCSKSKSFAEYGFELSENCEMLVSNDITNYCELGSLEGENINLYYCRPMNILRCQVVDSSGDIKEIQFYGLTKVLDCSDGKERLVDVKSKKCEETDLGFDCSDD
jgi:hypothetical protein